MSSAQLIEGYSNTPDITFPNFLHFYCLFQYLWGHVMWSSSEGSTLFCVYNLCGQSKICYFNLFIFEQYICRFDISMQKSFGCKICASGDNLFGNLKYFLFVPIELMIMYVFLQIFFAVFKKQVKIVVGLFNIEEGDYVGVFQVLKGFVLVLDAFDEVVQLRFQYFFDVFFLDNFACEWLVIFFVAEGFVSGSECTYAEAVIHLDDELSDFLIFFFHL